MLDVLPPSDNYEEASHYVVTGDVSGAVLPTANFYPIVWVMAFEELAIALSHASNASAQRTIKLSDDHFTKLSRFLGTKNTVHAYGAIQKVFVSLAAENQELAMPVSINYFAVAGDIEDTATNAPRVVRRVRTMIDNFYFILGIELMHAAQAVNLRLQQTPDLALSSVTETFRSGYRKVVPFLDEDRVLTTDIEASYQFLKNWEGDTK